jgi:hypothetical protein
MDTKKIGLGGMLFSLAVGFATIYAFAYVAGKGWKKANN